MDLEKISPGLSTFKTRNAVVYLGCGKSVQTLNTGGDVTQKREKKEVKREKEKRKIKVVVAKVCFVVKRKRAF